MTEPLLFPSAPRTRRIEQIQREYVDRWKQAHTYQQMSDAKADYLRALALMGIGPDDMEAHGCIVPPAANSNPEPDRVAEPVPTTTRLRRAAVMMAVAGGFFVLSWVYLLIAIASFVTYYPRRVYYRLTGK